MPSLNKVILVGHLTKDPAVKFLPTNVAVCEGGIAVTDKWKDRDGKPQERTCFIDFAIFGKSGEAFNQYAAKGRAVLLEAKLKLDSWEDKNGGGKRYRHSLLVDQWQLLDRREDGGERQAMEQKTQTQRARAEQIQNSGPDLPNW